MLGRWVIAGITVLVLAACTAVVGGAPEPGGFPGEPPKLPRPSDRDARAVGVALRQLDACAVIDLAAVKAMGNPAAILQPMGPHACMIVPAPPYGAVTDGVMVQVGDGSNGYFRDVGTPVTIQGAKAYEIREYSDDRHCRLLFPVSFTRGIKFEYNLYRDDIDTCAVLRSIAEKSVTRLRNPDAITVDPARRPGAAWDGCLLLAQLVGADYTYEPQGIRDPFSGCASHGKKSDDSVDPGLEVAYDKPVEVSGQSRRIGGRVVGVSDSGVGCTLTWNQAASRAGNEWLAALVFKLRAETCDGAAELAAGAMRLAGQAPGDVSTKPRRPLLYGPDENDGPAVGACAHFGPLGESPDCEPYHEVSVPEGTERIMEAAGVNRNVQCAVFEEAVGEFFGAGFRALTWGAHCYFVEPSHRVRVRVNVDGENRPSDFGRQSASWTDRREIRIAGKAAVTFWDVGGGAFDVYLSPYDDLTRPGNVHVYVEAVVGVDAGTVVKLDPVHAETAEQVIAEVTEKYFT